VKRKMTLRLREGYQGVPFEVLRDSPGYNEMALAQAWVVKENKTRPKESQLILLSVTPKVPG
jgi:hypothetical protein